MRAPKRTQASALAVAAAMAAALAVSAAGARTAFNGNVCSLLSAKQVAA